MVAHLSAPPATPKILRLFVGMLLVVAIAACVKRDNPYDPLNYEPFDGTERSAVVDSALSKLMLVLSDARTLDELLDSLQRQLDADSLASRITSDSNGSILQQNSVISLLNDTLQVANDNTHDPDSLRPLSSRSLLFSFKIFTTDIDTPSISFELRILFLRADSIMQAYNSAYAPHIIIQDSIADSTDALFEHVTARYDLLINAVAARFSSTAHNNVLVDEYNDSVAAYNHFVFLYNQNLSFKVYPVLTSADTIQAKLTTIAPGDTIVIGAGQFSRPLRITNPGTVDAPIVIAGQPDMSSVFSNSDALLSSHKGIIFRNLVFTGSDGPGFNIVDSSSGIQFINCEFRNNTGSGIDITDSDVELVNCRITENHGSGIRASGSAKPVRTLTLRNVLIAQNDFNGIEVVSTILSLDRVTITGNRTDGIYLHNPEQDLFAFNSCIVGNRGFGINYVSQFNGLQTLLLGSVAVSDNSKGPFNATIPSSISYITVPFLFENLQQGDYAPVAGGYYDTLEDDGVIIGYRRP